MEEEPLKINVAATCYATRVLGPGRRFVISRSGVQFPLPAPKKNQMVRAATH
jgi:hypothetical protein